MRSDGSNNKCPRIEESLHGDDKDNPIRRRAHEISERAAQIPLRSEITRSRRHWVENEREAERILIQGNSYTVTGRTTETCDHAELAK